MGRKSRHKQQRRRSQGTAAFTVLSPGMLEVLSVGKGDLKIEIGDTNADRASAQRIIEEMLRKGYTLFVETPGGPQKVTRFLPDEMVYVVADTPDVVPEDPAQVPGDEEPAAPVRLAARKRGGGRKVPVKGSRTTAVGRTAGG